MPIRIKLGNEQIGTTFKRSMRRKAVAVRGASRLAAAQAAEQIRDEGRADIAAAGNFGTRWTQGLQTRVTEGGGHIRVTVTMAVPYWIVFEEGRVIQGKPLLWIPLSFASDAQGVMARDYPGPLFRVDRKAGAPLLLTTGGEPKYFGKESVTIPKKFHLREIIRRATRSLPQLYRSNFGKLNRG